SGSTHTSAACEGGEACRGGAALGGGGVKGGGEGGGGGEGRGGRGGRGRGGDEATDYVGPGQESDHHALTHHGETVDILGAHQIGDVGERLVLRQAQHRPGHRLLRRDELRIGRAALQLGAGRCVKLPGLGALHEVGDQEAQQLAVGDHSDERATVVHYRQRADVVLHHEAGDVAQRALRADGDRLGGHDVAHRELARQLH